AVGRRIGALDGAARPEGGRGPLRDEGLGNGRRRIKRRQQKRGRKGCRRAGVDPWPRHGKPTSKRRRGSSPALSQRPENVDRASRATAISSPLLPPLPGEDTGGGRATKRARR